LINKQKSYINQRRSKIGEELTRDIIVKYIDDNNINIKESVLR